MRAENHTVFCRNKHQAALNLFKKTRAGLQCQVQCVKKQETRSRRDIRDRADFHRVCGPDLS